jgi:hypothetical protein
MEPEDSLPRTQEPSNGPYYEPDHAGYYISSHLSKIYFNIVHPLTSRSSCKSLSFCLSHQFLYAFLFSLIRVICPAHLIHLDYIVVITFGEEYML